MADMSLTTAKVCPVLVHCWRHCGRCQAGSRGARGRQHLSTTGMASVMDGQIVPQGSEHRVWYAVWDARKKSGHFKEVD
ncbi:hypothetical protein ACOMHN_053258 [Nucella lapillus]